MGLKESGLRGSLRNVSVEISAIPDSVLEDFEWGGPLSDRYDGFFRGAEVEQDSSLEGSFLVETGSGDDDECTFYNDEGVETKQGRAYSCYVDVEGIVRPAVLMHVNPSGFDCYGFRVRASDNDLWIMKQDGGTDDLRGDGDWDETLASESSTVTDAPSTFVFGQSNEGTLRFEFYNDQLVDPEDIPETSPDATLTTSDDDFTSGTIGFAEDVGDSGPKFDYYVELGDYDDVF